MPKLLRAVLLLILLMTFSIPALADNGALDDFQQDESDAAIVRVIPDEASVGSDHVILITGLLEDEQVEVRIIFEETDTIVYRTTETANDRGIVEVDIFTEGDDIPGEYRIEVVNGSDDVIGTASLTILEAEVFEPEVTVEPLEAEAGAIFTVEITDIRPFAILEVIIDDESGQEIFSQRARATVDGVAVIDYTSDLNSTGILSLRVVESETTIIFEAEITVLEQDFPARVAIDPVDALPGDTVFVTLSGLDAETAVIIEVIIDDVVIDTIEESANVSGLVIFPYDFAEDAALGRYQFRVYQNDEQVGFETYVLDIQPVSVSVTPAVGTVGTIFSMTVSDLRAGEDVTVEFSFDNTVVQTLTSSADADGVARFGLGQRLELEIGVYRVTVYRAGREVYSQTVEIAEERPETISSINPDDVAISVSPESGPVPTTYTLVIEGVPADTDLTLFILFNGQSILSISGTTDADGFYTTQITSEDSDPPGVYTLEVRAEGSVIGSVDFEIADETSDTDDDEPVETVEGDAAISIDPETVVQGERVEIIVSNLTPEETVTIDVLFDGDVVYSTESTADASGATAIALRASDDDETGDYEVQVSRDGDVIANDSFEIVDDAGDVDSASLTVSPEAAPQGEEFVITVSGLEAGESAEVTVSLDGDVVYETERDANSQGTFTIVLNSDGSDETGDYEVTVVRENGDELDATLTITDGDAPVSDDEPAGDPEISVDPEEGEIGTNHVVTVTGLVPESDFIFIITYDGEVVYEVERSADEDGNFSTVVVAGEGDPTGEYEIIIEHGGDDLSATIFVIGEDDEPVVNEDSEFDLSIEPQEVEPQETFEITVTGLNAGEGVIIEVVFDDEIVYETERDANEDGEVTLVLSSEEGDPAGIYTIVVRRGDDVLSEDVLLVDDSPTVEIESDVVITVDPDSARVGSEYLFSISGLGSNEEFDIVVSIDGETVYETTRTADASGLFTIRLETDDSDEAGIYTFSVLRDGEVVGSVDFEVEEELGSGSGSGDEDEIEAENAIISYAEDVNLEFDRNISVQSVEFAGQAGDVISVTVTGENGIDTVATLYSPDGVELASDDDGGPGLDPEIERVVLPESGTYTLEVSTFVQGETGSVVVNINRDDLRTLDEPRTVRLDSKTVSDILTYEGEAGEIVSLIIELDSGNVGSLVISAEQDDVSLMNYETSGLPGIIILGFVVPEDGNVVITFTDDGTGSAILDVSIESE